MTQALFWKPGSTYILEWAILLVGYHAPSPPRPFAKAAYKWRRFGRQSPKRGKILLGKRGGAPAKKCARYGAVSEALAAVGDAGTHGIIDL
jgi:hypothetical protein